MDFTHYFRLSLQQDLLGAFVALPDYQDIMLPLLNLTVDGEVHTIRGLKDIIARELQLSEEDLNQMLPSGQQSTFHNRVSWAKTYLLQAGLIEHTRRGHFTISPRGREVLASNPKRIDKIFLERFPEFLAFKGRSGSNGNTTTDNGHAESPDRRTPEEALQAAYKELRDDLAGELLAQIKGMSPQFFERLVLDLMLAMGYGGAEQTASLTGAGADEGIDGVINEDRLGLDIIYLQAKRWGNYVGRPEIQRFVGALHGKRARKGVFLTTSTFSRDAHDYVATIDPKVVLIDGQRLSQLMIDFDVGVSTAQTFAVKRVDSDYFAED
jgi:restriction system protein